MGVPLAPVHSDPSPGQQSRDHFAALDPPVAVSLSWIRGVRPNSSPGPPASGTAAPWPGDLIYRSVHPMVWDRGLPRVPSKLSLWMSPTLPAPATRHGNALLSHPPLSLIRECHRTRSPPPASGPAAPWPGGLPAGRSSLDPGVRASLPRRSIVTLRSALTDRFNRSEFNEVLECSPNDC